MLCDDPEGWDGAVAQGEGIQVHLQLIHIVVKQKLIQHCNATIIQLKNEK